MKNIKFINTMLIFREKNNTSINMANIANVNYKQIRPRQILRKCIINLNINIANTMLTFSTVITTGRV